MYSKIKLTCKTSKCFLEYISSDSRFYSQITECLLSIHLMFCLFDTNSLLYHFLYIKSHEWKFRVQYSLRNHPENYVSRKLPWWNPNSSHRLGACFNFLLSCQNRICIYINSSLHSKRLTAWSFPIPESWWVLLYEGFKTIWILECLLSLSGNFS